MNIKKLNEELDLILNEISDDSSEEIIISNVDKFIKQYGEDILEVTDSPVELFSFLWSVFNFKKVYNNFTVDGPAADDADDMGLYPNWDEEEPIFCLSWKRKKLFIYQPWDKYEQEWSILSYNYSKSENLILAELNSKLFVPETKQDLIKFVKIAKEECERILTDFDNNIIRGLEDNLFNPKFKEWKIEPALDDKQELVIRSNGAARIHIKRTIEEGKDVFYVSVRTETDNKEYVTFNRFNTIPTIKDIKNYTDYDIPEIQGWEIPEIPKTLVSSLVTEKIGEFDSFLLGLRRMCPSGYLAVDEHVNFFEDKPTYKEAAIKGYDENLQPIYGPGWSGRLHWHLYKKLEDDAKVAYKQQYGKSLPSGENAIWKV